MSEVYTCLKGMGERVLWEGYVAQVLTQVIADSMVIRFCQNNPLLYLVHAILYFVLTSFDFFYTTFTHEKTLELRKCNVEHDFLICVLK